MCRPGMIEYRAASGGTLHGRDGELLAVALTDVLKDGLSMVYSFYEPEPEHRSLGTFMILDHICQGAPHGPCLCVSRLLGPRLPQDGLQEPVPAAGTACPGGMGAGRSVTARRRSNAVLFCRVRSECLWRRAICGATLILLPNFALHQRGVAVNDSVLTTIHGEAYCGVRKIVENASLDCVKQSKSGAPETQIRRDGVAAVLRQGWSRICVPSFDAFSCITAFIGVIR